MESNEKGQALIELIIFLPIMFMMYSMIAGFANAINGSINQQKITRSYFYYRTQNNSTIPKPDGNTHLNWNTFGMFFIGWKDYFEGGSDDAGRPIAPCYRLSIPMQTDPSDVCETKYTSPSSQYIRVQTVYGICGGTYIRIDNSVTPLLDYPGSRSAFLTVASAPGCYITQ